MVRFHELAGHEDDDGFARARGGEDEVCCTSATNDCATGGKVQVAEQQIVAAAARQGESFFRGGSAIHTEAVSGEAFLEQHANAFFIVKNENGAIFEGLVGGRRDV